MQPDSYPFSSNLRVLCERRGRRVPVQRGPGGRRRQHRRCRPGREPPARASGGRSDAPGRGRSADPWAGQTAAVAGWLERGEAPTEATGAQATRALRVALAANRSLESGRAEDI